MAKWSIWADKLSRNASTKFYGASQRAPEWERPNFRLTNIRNKSVVELLGAISLKAKNDVPNLSLLKGETYQFDQGQKSTKAQRKRARRFMEMEICLEVQHEIDEGRIPNCAP